VRLAVGGESKELKFDGEIHVYCKKFANPTNAQWDATICYCYKIAYEVITFIIHYSNIYPTRCNFTQFILYGNGSTCFGWYFHSLSGTQTTVSTASGISHTVMVKGKASPLQAWTGSESSRSMRLPDFKTIST
jgi:hypothetical protein